MKDAGNTLTGIAVELHSIVEGRSLESQVRRIIRRSLRVLRLSEVDVRVMATRSCRLVRASIARRGNEGSPRYRLHFDPKEVGDLPPLVLTAVIALQLAQIWQWHQSSASRSSTLQRHRIAGAVVRKLAPAARLTKRVVTQIVRLTSPESFEVPISKRMAALTDGWQHDYLTPKALA